MYKRQGSTGGGIKVARLLLLGKYARCERKRIVSPREISLVRMDGKVVDDDIMREVNLYMTSYFAVIAASFLLVSLDNFDIETTISSVLACLNNIGPGLGLAGPMSSVSYTHLKAFYGCDRSSGTSV